MRQVFMVGPEANHYMLVSHAPNFRWRDSSLGDLIPLIGDGLLTIDGDYHRRARRIMLPAFHRDAIAAAIDIIVEEAERALADWRIGQTVDVYAWARGLAMRALLSLDPDDRHKGARAAEHFERALAFYETEYPLGGLRGPAHSVAADAGRLFDEQDRVLGGRAPTAPTSRGRPSHSSRWR